jgi:hypothetical protein
MSPNERSHDGKATGIMSVPIPVKLGDEVRLYTTLLVEFPRIRTHLAQAEGISSEPLEANGSLRSKVS